MARPRQFDETTVLDAAVECFWSRGFEATSIRDLMDRTGLTGASLYNAFGDKQALFQRALDHYVENSLDARFQRCQCLPPRQAIESFFDEILQRSLADPDHKGCMLVNAALDAVTHDPALRAAVAEVMTRIEAFFRRCLLQGQADGSIATAHGADDLARHLLGVLIGVRVLARVRPDPALLRGVVAPALARLDPGGRD